MHLHLSLEVTNRQTEKLLEEMPSWAQCGLGCDDMTDAFRQSPVSPEQQGVNVVAFFAPSESWWFSEVHGLVYGMNEELRAALQPILLPSISGGTQDGGIGHRPVRR